MALPPTIYATLPGPINPDTMTRIVTNLTGATRNGVTIMHLMMQSSGGNVGDGIALYNIFRTLPFELNLYNGGMVASIAVIAFMGGRHRYASAHSSFMIHRTRINPQSPPTASQLRAFLPSLRLDDKRTEAILRTHTKIPAPRWRQLASGDVYFSADEAVQFGLADSIREFQVPAGNQIYDV
jgi:ATP-dependent Clp protease, protease subunit